MTNTIPDKKTTASIRPGMKILDIVAEFRATETVFKKWDATAGECICCHALFDSLEAAAKKYGLDLAVLTKELEAAAAEKVSSSGDRRNTL